MYLASKVKVVGRPFKEMTFELRLECENGAGRTSESRGKHALIRSNEKCKDLDSVLTWPVGGQKKSEWLKLEKERNHHRK